MEAPASDRQAITLQNLPHDLQWEGHPSALVEVLFSAEKLAWSSHLLVKFTERKLRRKYARVDMNKIEEKAFNRIVQSNDQLRLERQEMQRVVRSIRAIFEDGGFNSEGRSDLLRLQGSLATMQAMVTQLNKTLRISTRHIAQAMTLLEKAAKRQQRHQAAIAQP